MKGLLASYFLIDFRLFIENFCAGAYFIIPEFRNRILECILKPNDPPLTEWRGTEFKLEEDIHVKFES